MLLNLKRVLEETWDDLEPSFAPDPMTGSLLPSMLVVGLAMLIETSSIMIVILYSIGWLR